MCGIVGFAAGPTPRPAPPLDAMRDALRHRGPDDEGTWWAPDGRVGLAMRRLAIIDLSPGGHQPMLDQSGRLCITFNGEIYNYRLLRGELEGLGHTFRSASDTEVILEAYREWGDDCVTRLNGMFAFGLYDRERRRLFLARDRAGEKPLYYRRDPSGLVFASELKALMTDPAFPREVDREALESYVTFGYVPGDLCILRGVRKLPPAHAMSYDVETGVLQVRRYWSLPPLLSEPAPEPEGLTEELEALLLDSVRLRLIADVPVGILLSGGLDSSLVTAMAARASSAPVRTFTISFPGHRAHDEAPYARLVARHFGTVHTELAAEPATVELLPELARQFDEPMADSSMVPTYLVSRLIRQQATVALGGDGGDELFGGYLHYGLLRRQLTAQRWIPRPVRQAISSTASRLLPLGVRGRNYLVACDDGVAKCISHVSLFFDAPNRKKLLAPLGGAPGPAPEQLKMALCAAGATPLQMATTVDFQMYLPDDILVKVDRASMLTSLEVRAPWLDPRLIEFAFGRVPESLRVAGGHRKILPKRLAARLLPPELDIERKQGFSLPLAAWLRGEWGRFVEQTLDGDSGGPFDPGVVRELVANQKKGYRNTERLFALMMFELWRRQYRVAV
jgi:asparagine synthase (glutamine-hydrolysing)